MNHDEIRGTVARINEQVAREQAAQLEAASKPWWQSRTIWGAVIVLVAQVALMFGVAIDVPAMTESALSLATLVGAVLAWWGRLQAQQPVSRTRVIPGVELEP